MGDSRLQDLLVGPAIGIAILLTVALGLWVFADDSTTDTSAAPARPSGPPALLRDPASVTLAQRAGDVVVGAAARPGGPIDITAVPVDGRAVSASAVTAAWRGRRLEASSCGNGCARVSAPVLRGSAGVLRVRVRPRRGPAVTATLAFPAAAPSPASPLLRALNRRMHGLDSVRVAEHLDSGVGVLRARFMLRAPNRLSYVTSDGARAVVIGARRWDKVGGPWKRSPTSPLRVPSYMWDGASHARLVGRATLDGVPTRVVSAFRSQDRFPAWFRLYVTRDARVLRAEMLAPAHFMVDRFSGFDAPVDIRPPQ